jgi:hypothetical protein
MFVGTLMENADSLAASLIEREFVEDERLTVLGEVSLDSLSGMAGKIGAWS